MRVIKDGNGDVLQRFDYYPFGGESRVWTAGTSTPQSALRYRFGGKEIAGQRAGANALAGTPAAAAGSPYLDFGARLYDPRTAAWLSQDPMAEKYYPIGPYVYCTGNPVNLVDPTGEDIWGLSSSGHIARLEENSNLFELVLLDENGESTDKKFPMQYDDVFLALSRNSGVSSFVAPASQKDGLLSLFFFLADNTVTEWAFHYNSENVVLGTTHEKEAVGNWDSLGLSSRPSFSIHSHPDIEPKAYDEYFSMGMVPVDYSYKRFNRIIGFDWDFVQDKPMSVAKNYFVYFPNSKNFYQLGYPNKVRVGNNMFSEFR